MRALALALGLVVAPAAALAGAQPVAGTWHRLPAAPIVAPDLRVSVWTGRQMLVFGRHAVTATDARGNPYVLKSVNVAAAYDPAGDTWRRLAPPAGPGYSPGYSAVWTGKEMLVWGAFDYEAYNPATNQWRRLPRAPTDAGRLVVWTGRELLGWGGGCCGDAFSDGAAYNPATNTWRKLARSPLAGSQQPIGAWTGRELIILVGNLDPNGKPWPARLARAAAYNPATDTWRRIAPLPAPRGSANAVWDGRDVLVVGGGGVGGEQLPAAGFAYDPATNRWRRLAPMPSGRAEAGAVWTGRQLLVWGGGTGRVGSLVPAGRGLAYDPKADRWSSLPQAPVQGRLDPTAVWTGHALVVWGGEVGNRHFGDGAAFRPATP